FATIVWLALAPLTIVLGQVSITCPPTITISCNVEPLPSITGTATGTTTCGFSSAVTITHTDNNGQMTGCMGTGTLLRTWIATDLCGFAATCMQSRIVEDNTSPTLTCPSVRVISCETD